MKKLDDNYYGLPHFKEAVITEMVLTSAMKHRRILFNEGFNDDTAFKANYLLNRIVDIDNLEGCNRKPIEIIINSSGGSIYAGAILLGTIETLKNMGYEIITTVNARAMSMGFMLSIVGTKRRATRYATFLCHQPSSGMWGTLKDIEDDVAETKRLWEIMKDIIKKNTKITDDMLEVIYREKRDAIYNPTQALELGVIDEII